MRRQIEYHLAHARAAASGATPGARCDGRATSADGLARTLLAPARGARHRDRRRRAGRPRRPLPARGPRRDARQPARQRLQVGARSRVALSSSSASGRPGGRYRSRFSVDDDGPGLAPSMREAVLQRGVRADEAAPGSGFGLAIVRELAELYGGSIALDESPLGGLRARLPPARQPRTNAVK